MPFANRHVYHRQPPHDCWKMSHSYCQSPLIYRLSSHGYCLSSRVYWRMVRPLGPLYVKDVSMHPKGLLGKFVQ